MAESYVQVSTTTDQREEADKLADLVVERRLAACAQIVGPITSTYWWQGVKETAVEWLILMKTTGARGEELIATIKAEHSYETPEITAVSIVAGHAAYLEWIAAKTEPPEDDLSTE
jgi:periplasmic divalent cation tolerance protein